MSTAIFVVTSALEEIGATSIINPASPDTNNACFTRLIQMINSWTQLGIDLGDSFVLPTVLADDMLNDANTDLALIGKLAIQISPFMRKTPTKDQKDNAGNAYTELLVTNLKRPNMAYPSTLPRGAGRRSVPFGRRYYTEPTLKDTQTVQPDEQ